VTNSQRFIRVLAAVALTMGAALASVLQPPSAQAAPTTDLVISEFRVRGPSGANDEFIEIANKGPADHTVAASSGAGYGIAVSDGVTRCTIPNGTIIPKFGHYLCVNSVAYSLSSYPAGNFTTAVGDATYTTDIPDNAGIALFDNNSGGASYDLAHRIDAVGSTSVANTLYKEGTGYSALTPFSIDHSFYRNLSTAAITPIDLQTTTPGVPEDTDNNALDFVFVDTNGTSAGAGQRLGAPGPENLSSPIGNGGLQVSPLDPCVSAQAAPNVVRATTSDPANNSTFGTYEFRRTITNNTGGNVTRLRLRVADVRTFPAPNGIADLRPRTSSAAVVTVDRAPCGSGTSDITVQGTTLEQPPSQPNGGGFNSSLSVGVVTLANPLAPGASIDVRLLAGLQQTGGNAVRVIAEAITSGTVTTPALTCFGGETASLCNTSPTPVDDGPAVTNEDTDLTVAAPGVLSNDTDTDNDALTAELVTGPNHGTLNLAADGSYTYSPDADYHGDDSFTYKAHDPASTSAAAATVTLQVDSVNDTPVAVDDGPTHTPEDTDLSVAAPGVLSNDTDTDNDSLTAELVTGPTHGTLDLEADGSYTYTPDADYHGPDSFTYKAHDLGAASAASATATLQVDSVDDPPPPPPPMCAGRPATLVGTGGDDVLTGTIRADVIVAGAGDDRIIGLRGDDVICARGGDDRIDAGPGLDRLYGESGRDQLSGGHGNDTLAGGASRDLLFAADGNDTLAGNTGRDLVVGGPGHDRLRGGSDADALLGGRGDDGLWGGTGNDLLDGGPGTNHLRGGPGRDRIVG
jgi:VCBS repeat-containing protein